MYYLICLLFSCFALVAQAIPLFHPPEGWEYALPDNHSPFLQVGFVGKGSTAFRPSINLAIEEVDVSAKQYLKAVKEIHLSEPNTTWRDLGKFATRAGEGRLTEIGKTSPVGEIKMLQMVVVKENMAYILTGAAIKADYLQLQSTFTRSFQSFALPADLLAPLSPDAKKRFEDFFASIGKDLSEEGRASRWMDLQKIVQQETAKMGGHWQVLMLIDGREKIFR